MAETLSYAPGRRGLWIRRFARWTIGITALLTLAVVARKEYSAVFRRASMLYYQHRLSASATVPVEAYRYIPFTLKDGQLLAGMISCSGGNSTSLGPDANWDRLRHISRTQWTPAEDDVYVHSIADPHGNQFIAAVKIGPIWGRPHSPYLDVDVVKAGSLFADPAPAQVTIRPFQFENNPEQMIYPQFDFKIFIGQPDPADPSHFTIDYELKGQRHTLDGYLNEQDVLAIEQRREPTSLQSETVMH